MSLRGDCIVVMGVCGSGKTTIARRLAEARGGAWLDADDYHSLPNVERMRRGLALDDRMRWPWLAAVSEAALRERADMKSVTVACSALKRRYRDFLRERLGAPVFVLLEGPADLIRARMSSREGHFMPEGLLESQLEELERPQPDEDAVTVDIRPAPQEIVRRVLNAMGSPEGPAALALR